MEFGHRVKDPGEHAVYVGVGWFGYTLILFIGGLWGRSAALLDPSVPMADLAGLLFAWGFVFAPIWIGLPWITWNLYQAHLEQLAGEEGPVPRSERGERRARQEPTEPVERTPFQMYIRLSVALVVAVVLSLGILLVFPLDVYGVDDEELNLQIHAIVVVFLGVFGLATR